MSSSRFSQPETDTISAPHVLSGQFTSSREQTELKRDIQALDEKRLQKRAEFRKTTPEVAETERFNQEESQYWAEREVLVQKLKALSPPRKTTYRAALARDRFAGTK